MYEIKKQIYLNFTKNQKSALCNFLRALVKKSEGQTVETILENFLEDEKYYLEQNCSRFEFLEPIIDEEEFYGESYAISYLKEKYGYKLYAQKLQKISEASLNYMEQYPKLI